MILTIQAIRFHYPGRPVLEGASFAVEKGQVLAEIIDPLADPDNAVAGQIIAADAGRFFAHANQRLAWPGEVVGEHGDFAKRVGSRRRGGRVRRVGI